MYNKKVIAVHLLNDWSGSPFVLRQALEVLVKEQYEVELFTATPGGQGFLSGIRGVQYRDIPYRWSKNRWMTLFFYLFSQGSLFFRLLFRCRRADIVYINSILPFGAALAGWLRGATVVYHIHEVSVRPPLLKKFLVAVANLTAKKGLFVSNDVRKRTSFLRHAQILYNALPSEFTGKALEQNGKPAGVFTVLMICSLKAYKGVREYAGVASRLPQYRFMLVLNATEPAISDFFKGETLPANLEIFPAQADVHPFYMQADIVMNMSLPAQWVETFGMTILEAMYYKKPAIIPCTGGITELVTDGVEGYQVNPRDIDEVSQLVSNLANDTALYQRMSAHAFSKARQFSFQAFAQGITHTFRELSKHGMTDAGQQPEPVGTDVSDYGTKSKIRKRRAQPAYRDVL